MEMWEHLFGYCFFDQYLTTDFPMLIGIGRCTPEEKLWFSPPDYRYQVLMRGDRLTQHHEQATRESVLKELKLFRDKFHRNEIELVSWKEQLSQMHPVDVPST